MSFSLASIFSNGKKYRKAIAQRPASQRCNFDSLARMEVIDQGVWIPFSASYRYGGSGSIIVIRKPSRDALRLRCASRHIGVDEVDEGLLIVDRGVK